MALVLVALSAYAGDVVRVILHTIASPESVAGDFTKRKPIAVLSVEHLFDNAVGAQGYVVDSSVNPAPAQSLRTSHEDVGQWAEENNAVDLAVTAWEVAVEGTRSEPVAITNIVPLLEKPCDEALRGGVIRRGSEGISDNVNLEVDITQPSPNFNRRAAAGQPEVKNFFRHKKITLQKGEKEVLTLRAKAISKKHCRWRYRIDYLADGKKNSMKLSAPDGAPFEVTGPHPGTVFDNEITYDWVVPSPAERSGCNDKTLPKLTWNEFVRTWNAGAAGGIGCGG